MDVVEMRGNMRTLVIASAGLALMAIGVLLLMAVSATITGDLPPSFTGDWVINNPTTVRDEDIYILDGNITVNSKLTIERSTIWVDWWFYYDIYDIKVTSRGSMSVTDSTFGSSWGGGVEYLFEGAVHMDGCDVMHADDGIVIKSDNVDISNSNIIRCYNLGIHVIDSSPSFSNVYVDVQWGAFSRSYSTDRTYDYDYPLRLACPTGIWVEGGAPTFEATSVYTYSAARFDIEYTGTQADATIVMWAMAAPVLVESRDISDVSGLTVEYADSQIVAYVDATDPGPNPQRFSVEMQAMAAGIVVWNYESVAITSVEVRGAYYWWPQVYVSGGSVQNNGYANYGPSLKVVAAITEEYSDATLTTTSVAFESMDVGDGNYLFMHGYWPTYSGTNVPSFSDEVYVKGITAGSYGSPIITIMMGCDYARVRNLEFYTQVTGCTFSNLYGRVLDYNAIAGPGIDPTKKMVEVTETLLIDNCSFSDSWAYDPIINVHGVWANHLADNWDRTVELADNTFSNIGDQLFTIEGIDRYAPGTELLQVVGNDFLQCYNDDYYNMFSAYYFDQVRFLGNGFTECNYPYPGYLWDSGGDANGVKADTWLFEGNTFLNSTAYYDRGLIRVEFGGMVKFTGNTYAGGDGLLSIWQYPEYSGMCTVRMTENEYYENMGPMVYWMRADEEQKELTVQVDNNTVYSNRDYFIDYEWTPDIDTFDNDALILVMDNDIHDNLAGCVHAWGDVRIINNDFNDNRGPLVTIDHINLHVPAIHGNQMARNIDVYELLAKERGYQLVALKLTDVTVDCTGVAIRFANMEVLMERVTIANAAEPIVAENTWVDAYDSELEGAGCSVVGDGRITMWWPVEVRVTWGDATGMDSGKPTPNALIVFYDAGNNYYSSANADDGGALAQLYYGQWRVDLDGLADYSPYTVKVAAAGAAIETSVEVDRALVGNDAVHIVLWDTFKPTVAVTDPLEGALFNVPAITATGFVAEIGSGMLTLERSLDGGSTWAPLVASETGDWEIAWASLPEGASTLHVRASDVAGNTATAVVHFSIDTHAPVITIEAPTADQLFNAPDVVLTGTVNEDGVKLFVNGMPKGVENKGFGVALTLNEGANVIVVEAIDVAGNHASASVRVALDTFAPVLVLMGPADGLLTREGSVVVKGIVEKGATLLVDGTAVVPDTDGTFSKLVTLDEGSNTIEVKATDSATNMRSVTKTVMRDSEPPTVSIVEPEDGIRVTASTVLVRIQADADAVLYLNGRMLPTKGQVDRSILLVEGTNTVTVKAVDPAGNEASDTVTIILDTLAPTLTVTSPGATEVWTNQDTIEIVGLATGATTVTINGVAAVYNSATGEFQQVVPIVAGENNITVVASDGNNLAVQVLKVWMSKALPILVVDNPPATVAQPTVTITGHTAIGIKKVAVKVPEGTLYYDVAFDGSFAVKVNLPDGQHTIEVSVTDAYGNTNKMSTSAFTVKATSLVVEEEDQGLSVQPMGIGAIIAVVGITLAVVAWMVIRSRRGRNEA